MAATLNPYLAFESNARQAMEFYRDVFGGDLRITPSASRAARLAEADKVMHPSWRPTMASP